LRSKLVGDAKPEEFVAPAALREHYPLGMFGACGQQRADVGRPVISIAVP
jgi:hypothetical protein